MSEPTETSDIPLPTDTRARLRAHFSVPVQEHGTKWSDLWNQDFIPWDQAKPSPALEDLFSERGSTLLGLGKGKTALVPGCGKGYDVALFASYGVDATGLEISETAVQKAREWHEQKAKEEDRNDWAEMRFLLGDFYENDWTPKEGFDFVYDYTFLCAMPLERRPDWSRRMGELVKPGGHLICLEFPLYKALETGGPPWGLTSKVYEELLSEKFEKILHYKPERTHEIGMGTDHIAVWKRKEN